MTIPPTFLADDADFLASPDLVRDRSAGDPPEDSPCPMARSKTRSPRKATLPRPDDYDSPRGRPGRQDAVGTLPGGPPTICARVERDSAHKVAAFMAGFLTSSGVCPPVLFVEAGRIIRDEILATTLGPFPDLGLKPSMQGRLVRPGKATPLARLKDFFDRFVKDPGSGSPESRRPDAPLDGGAKAPV